jgi:hypothetical protein
VALYIGLWSNALSRALSWGLNADFVRRKSATFFESINFARTLKLRHAEVGEIRRRGDCGFRAADSLEIPEESDFSHNLKAEL